MLGLGDVQLAVAQQHLHFIRQIQQTEVAPDGAPTQTDLLADQFVQVCLGAFPLLLNNAETEPSIGAGLLDIVEILALHIFNQLTQQQVGIIAIKQNTGHLFKAKLNSGEATTPAVNDPVAPAAEVHHAKGLEQPACGDGGRQTSDIARIFA